MYATEKYLRQFVTKELDEMSPEEICIYYQETMDNNCIAAMFCKMCNMFILLKQKYPFLNEEIAVSAALETMQQMMLEFKYNKNKTNKFTTLIYTAYSRRLYAEMKPFQKKKRDYRITTTNVSFDSAKNNDSDSTLTWYNSAPDYGAITTELDLITKASLDILELNDDERNIINFTCDGYKKKDIIEVTGMSDQTYCKCIKNLKNKLISIGIMPTEMKAIRA